MKSCFLLFVVALVLSGCSQTDPALEKAIRNALGKPKGNISAEDMESLTKLTLNDSQLDITDTGLAQLKGMSNLKELDLHSIKLTDAGLVHLKGLTKLKTLVLRNTQVTNEGREELLRTNPGLRIH